MGISSRRLRRANIKRFAGDPGFGKIWYGESNSGGSPSGRVSQLGKPIHLFRCYANPTQSVNPNNVIAIANTHVSNNRLPILSAKSPNNDWEAVANGSQDAWLDAILLGLANLNSPIWFSLHHEPTDEVNGTTRTRDTWIAMHERIKARVPTGALLAICPITAPFEPTSPLDWYSPLSCDIVGIDGYNHWYPAPYPSTLSYRNWREPSQVFGNTLSMAAWLNKPIAICEYGVRTNYNIPGKASNWMQDAFDYLLSNNVVGMSYFDSDQNVNDSLPEQEAPPWDLDHGGTVSNQVLETIQNGYPNGPERLLKFADILSDPRIAHL